MNKKWYRLWNGQADTRHAGKPCMVHTPVIPPENANCRHWSEDIAQWHVLLKPKGRGWRNPGYLFVIERDGTIYYCPETSNNQAHCREGRNNTASFGLSLVGDGTKQAPSEEQMSSLSKVLLVMKSKEIRYHRDFSPKECPGQKVMDSIAQSPLAGFVKRYKS